MIAGFLANRDWDYRVLLDLSIILVYIQCSSCRIVSYDTIRTELWMLELEASLSIIR